MIQKLQYTETFLSNESICDATWEYNSTEFSISPATCATILKYACLGKHGLITFSIPDIQHVIYVRVEDDITIVDCGQIITQIPK